MIKHKRPRIYTKSQTTLWQDFFRSKLPAQAPFLIKENNGRKIVQIKVAQEDNKRYMCKCMYLFPPDDNTLAVSLEFAYQNGTKDKNVNNRQFVVARYQRGDVFFRFYFLPEHFPGLLAKHPDPNTPYRFISHYVLDGNSNAYLHTEELQTFINILHS